jgi:BASS family bile acid:Na+ symporter
MDTSIVHELLRQSLPSTIAVFLASAMFSLGLGMTVGQIVEPLRNRRLIAVSLFANFVLVPLFALGLASVIPMDRALQTGFLLYAFASGAESGPKFVQLAAGNAAFALGLLVPMTLITVFGLPMVISLVVPDVHVARGAVLLKLLVVVAVPVGIGLYLRARYCAFATRLASRYTASGQCWYSS